jgi:hypothetical protein
MPASDDIRTKGRVAFYTQTALLDAYLSSADPSSDAVALEVIIQTLQKNEDLRKYFFRSSPHPAWAAVLWDRGFFQVPPPPLQEENGLWQLPWDEQEYLLSIASSVPEIVLKHFAALKEEPRYGARAINALQGVPVQLVESALPQILHWLHDSRAGRITAAATYELAVKQAEKKEVRIAFELFRAALKPQAAPSSQRIEGSFYGTEAVPLFPLDTVNYSTDANIRFKNAVNLFGALDIKQTLAVLEDHLVEALRLEGEARGFGEFERSSWWCNTIDDSDQDIRDNYKHRLLVALRDLLCAFVDRDERAAEPLLHRYLADEREILRRLGLHVLSKFPQTYEAYVARELLDSKNLDDAGVHHEYFVLLREGFPHLSDEKQRTLLNLIKQGPARESVERIAEWAQREYGDSRDNYIRNYTRQWLLKRLWMVREHLSGEFAGLLESLVAESGEPERPEYTHWTTGAYVVSDVSPLTQEQLYVMKPDVLVDFLRQWKPEQQQDFGPKQVTKGALGQAVADVIFSDFDRYIGQLTTLAFLGPAFAVPILAGFTANKGARAVRWSDALSLCEALLHDSRVLHSINEAADENWRGVRQTIVSLLEAGVEKSKPDEEFDLLGVSVPEQFLPRVRDLLLILVDDPDPTPESDRPPEAFFGHNDPATVALNHVRPRALIALVQYAVHRALRSENQNHDDQSRDAVSRLEPEVREALTAKLNPKTEPSSAVRSTFGWNLYRLRWLDESWLEAHLDAIFPEGDDPETTWLFVSAWDAYAAFNRNTFVRKFFEKLRPKYEKAINNLARGLVSQTHLQPSAGLAAHLLRDYLSSEYQLRSSEGENSLLVQFFKKAPPKERGGAAWLVWRMCEDNPQHLKDMWPRVRALWEWRVDESARANHPNDFDAEIEWYAKLPLISFELETIREIWALLEGTVPHVVRFQHRGIGWDSLEDYLAKEVHRDPLRSIQFYHLMHKGLKHTMWFYGRNESRTIIEIAAAHENSRYEALALIDTLARSGNHQYRDIYQQYAG